VTAVGVLVTGPQKVSIPGHCTASSSVTSVITAVDAGRAGGALLAGVALFQLGLAAGAPWGAAAWGGGHPGQLPAGLRAASAVSGVLLGSVAVAAAAPGLLDVSTRTRLLRGAAGYLALGTALNAVSRSPAERVWSPVSGVGAALLWRASSPSSPQA
jgi:hypothetical protein